jgi:hypothetical protein
MFSADGEMFEQLILFWKFKMLKMTIENFNLLLKFLSAYEEKKVCIFLL